MTISLRYRDAGVDIDAGNALVERIKPLARATSRAGVLAGLGGFGGLFELPKGYQEPVLVSGTDGVGTKLKLAMALDIHTGIGIDLVAMCVNDIVVAGAEPLFFLDYYATGKLELEAATQVIGGIAEGCTQAGCALLGGETAEMPGMYQPGDYDLAGFAVGIAEKSRLLDPKQVRPGDTLLGLASSGPHSNGYSLIRKIIEVAELDLASPFGATTLGEALLAPTRIYVKPLLALLKECEIHGMAHITGGGLTENLPRVLPQGCDALIRLDSWPRPEIFRRLQAAGGVSETEMLRTFNCGIGMIIALPQAEATKAAQLLRDMGEEVFVIGEIITNAGDQASVQYQGEAG